MSGVSSYLQRVVGWELLLVDPAAPANLTGPEQQAHRDYELLTGGQEVTVFLEKPGSW